MEKNKRRITPALEALREADPEALSPKEALELLYHLKKVAAGRD